MRESRRLYKVPLSLILSGPSTPDPVRRTSYNKVMTWRVVLEQAPESGEFAVWCPELPGCVSAGATEEEAKANIREAIVLFLEEEPIDIGPTARVETIAV